ncbi:MAG: universal stress protein [Deltaproteobacteria bacterium]|nr:universal stress protein [Deltaproteobacteria bacterium]
MYKKILYNTCLTEYCDHVFNFALNLAEENNARLLIYYGIGRLNGGDNVEELIKEGESKVAEAYVGRMKERAFDNYAINVTDGDAAGELSKLARNAGADLMVMSTSTELPLDTGESPQDESFSKLTAEALLRAPCPVLVIPPSLIPGLARG